jgi:large subunit ribosomal protein L33
MERVACACPFPPPSPIHPEGLAPCPRAIAPSSISEKLQKKKYDPRVRKHVLFVEGKP